MSRLNFQLPQGTLHASSWMYSRALGQPLMWYLPFCQCKASPAYSMCLVRSSRGSGRADIYIANEHVSRETRTSALTCQVLKLTIESCCGHK